MSDLEKARELLLRAVDHLDWARDKRSRPWGKQRDEDMRVVAFYEAVTEFLKATSPVPKP